MRSASVDRAGQQVVVGHDVAQEAPVRGLVRVEALAEQDHLAGALQADEARQQLGHAAGDEQAPGDFGKEEARAFGRDREVAVDDPFEAAADGPAADCADDGRVAEHHRAGDVLDALDIGRGAGLVGDLLVEILQVVAGAEGAALAGQHDGADPVVSVGRRRPLRRDRRAAPGRWRSDAAAG